MWTDSIPITEVARTMTSVKTALISLAGIWIVLLVFAACQREPGPSNATLEVPSGREPNASVSGTVTYRERLALTADAVLIVELRDVSYADAAAPLIARQTIDGPGQVPIKFKVEYRQAGHRLPEQVLDKRQDRRIGRPSCLHERYRLRGDHSWQTQQGGHAAGSGRASARPGRGR